jgi:hypothetical protein
LPFERRRHRPVGYAAAVDPVLHGTRLRPSRKVEEQEAGFLARPAIAKCSPAAAMRRTWASISRLSAALKGSSRLILATYGIRRRFIENVSSPFLRMPR